MARTRRVPSTCPTILGSVNGVVRLRAGYNPTAHEYLSISCLLCTANVSLGVPHTGTHLSAPIGLKPCWQRMRDFPCWVVSLKDPPIIRQRLYSLGAV